MEKEEVFVSLHYNPKNKKSYPFFVFWRKKLYKVSDVTLHYTFNKRGVLYHVFAVSTKSLFFKLIFNTQNLRWFIDAVYDSLSR